jgi:hypothetical protein
LNLSLRFSFYDNQTNLCNPRDKKTPDKNFQPKKSKVVAEQLKKQSGQQSGQKTGLLFIGDIRNLENVN